MILFLDISNGQTGRIGLISEQGIKKYSWTVDNHLSESLTDKVSEFIKKQKKSLKDVNKIIVVTGPGHFSRIRSGVTTANALALALNIRVIGVKAQEKYDWQKLAKLSGKKMVLPFYGKEPNITKAVPKRLKI